MIRRTALTALLALAVAGAHAAEMPEALKKARELATKNDFEGAAKILRTEAEKGSAEAANALGELYIAGRGVKASPAEALRWFQKAADAALPAGLFNVAALLSRGADGVAKDPAKAKFLMRSAAEAGSGDAQAAMGQAAEDEAAARPGTPDFSEARGWFEKAAAQEHPGGLMAMMRFSDRGLDGSPDLVKGAEYCRRAARAGSVVAMNEMAVRYQKGLGLGQDNVAAIGWFTLAAQHGLPAALVNLGNCYETGNGVSQDFDMAGRNYAAAAKQGFAAGQFMLAQMLEQGRGTEVNLAHAYVLFTRAGAQKIDDAVKRAEAIKPKLTAAQLEEVGKLLKSGATP